MKNVKLAIKCKQNEYLGYGTFTLYNWYKKYMDDWYEHQDVTYDIVFSIYDDMTNVKSKYKVLLCADQNVKTYNNYTKTFAKYHNQFTHVILLRHIDELFDEISKDFSNCKIFCRNFNLFDFDDNYTDENRKNEIVHLGRICNFKNSIDLINNTTKYLSELPIVSIGNNLLKTNKLDNTTYLNEKGLKYLLNFKYFNDATVNQIRNDKINFLSDYEYCDVYNIAKQYKYAIAFYDSSFNDNAEYAMLEMINAGCKIILNKQYVESFNSMSILGHMPYHIEINDNNTINDVIHQLDDISIKDYKMSWKLFYDSNKILRDIIMYIIK